MNAGSGFSSYYWNNGSTTQSIAVSVTVPGPIYQFYSVYATDPGGCIYGDSLWVLFNNCAAVNNVEVNNQFNVYPNPASNNVTLKLNNLPIEKSYFIIYDVIGHEVMKAEINSLLQTISLNEMSRGLYIYSIVSESKILGSGKVNLE